MSPVLLALALGASTGTDTKLGVVVVDDTSAAPASTVMAACPRLVVFPVPSASAVSIAQQVAAYKAACPAGKVVVQVGEAGLPVSSTTTANTLWFSTWQPLVQQINASLIDGVEGPWEPVGTPADLAAFWALLAQSVSASGFLPVIGALPPGRPSGFGTADDAFCTTVRQVRSAGVASFAWSQHVRVATATNPTDVALAFDQVATDCGLTGVTLFITKVLPSSGTWSSTDLTWLVSFDQQLGRNANAAGAALFALGASAGALDLTPIAVALAAHLQNPVFPDGGSPDGGADGGSAGGVIAPSFGSSGGELSPPKQGCSSAGPGLLAGAVVPALFLLRRRRHQGVKR